MTRVRDGRASAQVLEFGESDLYDDLALELAADGLADDPEDLVFLEDLRNGGDVGAGRRLLREAAALAHADGRVLVAVAVAESPEDQPRLLRWYGRLMYKVPGRLAVFSSKALAPVTGARRVT